MKRTLFAIALLAVCSNSLPVSAKPGSSSDEEWNSQSVIKTHQSRVETIDVQEISSNIPGKIVEMSVTRRGQLVKKGDVVVRLDSALVESQLEELNARADSDVLIKYAETTLKEETLTMEEYIEANRRAQEKNRTPDYGRGEMRRQSLAIERADAEVAKSKEERRFAGLERETKKVELSQYVIKAERDGIVSETHKKNKGSTVSQGQPILTIENLDRVRVVIMVDPELDEKIRIGDKVLVRRQFRERKKIDPKSFRQLEGEAKTDPSRTLVGVVTYIGAYDSSLDDRFEVEAEIENVLVSNKHYFLRPGLNVEARIIPASK